ncbi:MAG TPA: protein kinase, partial [Candidatus Krumholzibacteria bacterium]|nr:protein kinase [Candidatus Krumholzibacteria bacterium]
PANVVVTPDGEVKVLDFGLAKAVEGDVPSSGLSQSPTLLASSPTAAGVILGTAAYMSPEQARGKRVDRRADIFAFGCVLYEMLTGRSAFGGETVSDTLAAVLRADPDWSALPKETPPAIRTLLRRCLDKDPKQRLRDIGEARIVLDAVARGETGEPAPAAVTQSRMRSKAIWALPALVALCTTVWALTARRAPTGDTPLVNATINVPAETPLSLFGAHPGPPAISPDGRYVAFAVITPAGVQLAVRELARDEVRVFAGTDDAGYPFWSPDSRQIGFFAQGKLRRVDLSGGVPVTLCDAEVGKGGSWRADGTILFAPSYTTPIHRVSADGGPSEAVTRLDSLSNESSHRFPRLLPDGEHFLYVVRHFSSNDRGGHVLRVGSLDGTVSQDLFATESDALYLDGYLFFVREGALIAQPFNPNTFLFSGNPVKLAEGVQILSGAARGVFDVSPAGVLVYARGGTESPGHLLLLDGSGRESREISEAGSYDVGINLAPDGNSVLVGIFNDIGGTSDLWQIDLQRGARTRLTFDPGHDNNAHWSPDGTRVAFTARRGTTFGPYIKAIDGSAAETRVIETGTDLFNAGWSRDGRYLLCHELGSGNQGRLRAVPLVEGAPDPLRDHSLPQSLGGTTGLYRVSFSPDGRWMAYEATEGRGNIYAIPFGRPGQRWQVTLAGGANPRWAGRHLYFERERRLWK